MTTTVLLVVVTALLTALIMRWLRSPPPFIRALTGEEKEAGRAKDIGTQLDDARDRASLGEVERNKLALAKAVKAALWVTEARLNLAVPELLRMAQRWTDKSKRPGKKGTAPEGVTQIEGSDDPNSPWAAWSSKGQHWRLEGQWRPSILPEEIEEDIGTCKVFLDHELVLDMTISSKDLTVMWIDALTVGPWVSDLLAFAGEQISDAQALSSEQSARKHQDRADNIHWS
jgi:hypothetical protein